MRVGAGKRSRYRSSAEHTKALARGRRPQGPKEPQGAWRGCSQPAKAGLAGFRGCGGRGVAPPAPPSLAARRGGYRGYLAVQGAAAVRRDPGKEKELLRPEGRAVIELDTKKEDRSTLELPLEFPVG